MFYRKEEKIIITVSIIYFLLLAGYKLFSLYYPLFLSSKGFSLSSIGLNYFVLYFSLGLFSLLFFFMRKVQPKRMIIFSLLGYMLYSIGMLFVSSLIQFLLFQLLLGFFAGMFYVFARTTILEETHAKASEYGYFYIAPLASAFIAPIIGGILIFFFGFSAPFLASITVYLIAILVSYANLKPLKIFERKRNFHISNLYVVLFFFIMMLIVGIYRAFFVLFLKSLGMIDNLIILFVLITNAILFIPLSFLRRKFDMYSEREYVVAASLIYAFVTLIITFFSDILLIFALFLIQFSINVLLSSQKSHWLSKFSIYKKEIAIIDTCIESFGVAFGALISGLLLNYVSFNIVFPIFGLILITTIFIFYLKKLI